MNYYYIWMIVEVALLAINMVIMKKYRDQIVYQNWFEGYFIIHKIMTFLPGIILAWAGYIYLYDFFNQYAFYRDIYMDELVILVGYFVVGFLLFYLNENARKIYAIARAALLFLNIYQAYFIYAHRALLNGFDISRNLFASSNSQGMMILGLWLFIDLLNIYSFIQYYKYNRYEMTN